MAQIGSDDNPLRAAIVGSGPSGFYAAESLLKAPELAVDIDMIDRLPTPFGLVRAGVAPDHPKIKNVIRRYEKTAANDTFSFFGNVEVGRDVTPGELADRYHAVIYAYGSATDRKLGIPGEDLPGSHPATEFVAWYNAHPDFADREFNLDCERAVVIGNGNVAADVARMLALPRSELECTDTADYAIDALADSRIREIVVLGRRGPAQAAFTNPEVRELGELSDADVHVDPAEMQLDEFSREYLESDEADMTHRKNVETFREFAEREPAGKPKRVVLKFLASPVEILGSDRVEAIVIGRNELHRDSQGNVRPRDSGERETLECGLVLRSIGYKGIGIEGLPFDASAGVIPNDGGRARDPETGAALPGTYAVGWIKRGPSGVIGTNKKDADETVQTLLSDLQSGTLPKPDHTGRVELAALLEERGVDYVSYRGWEAIDAAEVAAGAPHERPRIKFTRVEEMLEAAKSGVSG